MKNILLIGAGRSAGTLIEYLSARCEKYNWKLTIVDRELSHLKEQIKTNEFVGIGQLDVANFDELNKIVASVDLVISMLPASMHVPVAKACIAHKKHMVTASYISPEMEALNDDAKNAGVVLMNEIGVDPGIDHLSAMKVLDEIRDNGGEMLMFESFTGGLISPECEGDNPWKYKFTWNPRNVVLAGAGGAVKFIQEGRYKYIPYHQVFRRIEFIDINGYGRFEGYANRDSLRYRSVYGLQNIPTIYRGTLRRVGFCRAWDVFVKLGMTDDSYHLQDSDKMTYRDFLNTFLAYSPSDSVELKLMHYLHIDQDDELMEKLTWLDLFSDKKVPLKNATPAQILQHILMQKWAMKSDDKDMIVMFHKFGYRHNGEEKMIESHMVAKGENAQKTAMAKTVGLPVGIAVKLILSDKIKTPGVHLPITKEIYQPMLEELAQHGIDFTEKQVPYKGY